MLIVAYRRYRKIAAIARAMPGSVATSFAVEGPRTFMTMSLWTDELAIALFETAAATLHPRAVRWATERSKTRWSAIAHAPIVSQSSRTWEGDE